MNPPEVQQEVRQLVALCGTANEHIRADCRSRLNHLRAFYSKLPAERKTEYFPVAAIRALKDAARLLDAAPDEKLRDLLRTVFLDTDDFRPGQEQIIRSVFRRPRLSGRDADRRRKIANLPASGQKDGRTTLVISPLIALMKDQVDALTRKGLRATYLN